MALFNKKEIKLFFTFFIIYITFITLYDWNEISSLDLALALGYENRLSIDSFIHTIPTGDKAYYKGHYYSDKAPGLALLSYPLIKIFKMFFGNLNEQNFWVLIFFITSLTSSLFSAGTTVLIYKISKYFTNRERIRLIATFAFGIGTTTLYLATVFKVDTIATFFAFFCFYLIFKMKKEGKISHKNIFIAGLFGGYAIILNYTTALIVLGIFLLIFTFKKYRALPIFLIGCLISVSFLLLYNFAIFGDSFQLTNFHEDKDIFDFSYLGSKEIVGSYLSQYFITNKVFNLRDRLLYTVDKIARVLVFPYRGFFIYSPILILSFIGLFYMYKKYKFETIIIFGSFVMYVLFFSSGQFWWSGTYGPRYLYIITPFLILPLIFIIKKLNIKLVLLFLFLSIFINIIGLQQQEWVGLSYGMMDSLIKHSHNCYFQAIANPLFDYYLPLFVKYGPQSYAIAKIFNLTTDHPFGITKIPNFLNIGIICLILFFIWRKSVFNFISNNKKTFYILIILILLLALLRIIYSDEVDNFTKSRLRYFYLDKECSAIHSTINKTFYVPYSLWIDPNLPVKIGKNKNWQVPYINGNKNHWSYGNATIEVYNQKDENITVELNFIAKGFYVNKTLKLFLNDKIINNFDTTKDFQRFTQILDLLPGRNDIKFDANEECHPFWLLCGDLEFRKIQIYTSNKHDFWYYDKNWYELDKDYLKPYTMAMSQDSLIKINSTTSRPYLFEFYIASYKTDRTLDIFFNNKKIKTYEILPDIRNPTKIEFSINLSKEESEIRFHSRQGCSKLNKQCISFMAKIKDNKVVSFY